MYHRTHSSMMSASNTRLRYIGSRAIGFVIQNLRPKIRQSTRCPWMHQNPVKSVQSCAGDQKGSEWLRNSISQLHAPSGCASAAM